MITRRVLVNIGVFLLLFLALAGWAVNNVLSFDFLERPYTVTADFPTSPGFRSGFQVTYLGVAIGKMGSVKATDDGVLVTAKIRRGVEIPAAVEATARRRSAIGEPYLDLSPTTGADLDGPRLANGAVITREHTHTPINYVDLFTAVDDLVKAIPPDDVHTLVHELATGLAGRTDSVRQLLVGVGDVATTFADNAPLLDQTITDLTALTHTVAAHAGELGQGIDNTAAFTSGLAASRQQLATLLESGPQFGLKLQALLDATSGDLGCLIDAAGAVLGGLGSGTTPASIERVFELAPDITALLPKLFTTGPDGRPYVTGTLLIDAGSEPPPSYPERLTLPQPLALTNCAGTLTGAPPAGPAGVPGGPGSGTGAGDTPATDPGAAAKPQPSVPASTDLKPDTGSDLVRYAAIAAVVLVLLALAALRPWRWLHRTPATPAALHESGELTDDHDPARQS